MVRLYGGRRRRLCDFAEKQRRQVSEPTPAAHVHGNAAAVGFDSGSGGQGVLPAAAQ